MDCIGGTGRVELSRSGSDSLHLSYISESQKVHFIKMESYVSPLNEMGDYMILNHGVATEALGLYT